ncbi:hypothetical protein ACJX0J_009437, partial [Zea mays]
MTTKLNEENIDDVLSGEEMMKRLGYIEDTNMIRLGREDTTPQPLLQLSPTFGIKKINIELQIQIWDFYPGYPHLAQDVEGRKRKEVSKTQQDLELMRKKVFINEMTMKASHLTL